MTLKRLFAMTLVVLATALSGSAFAAQDTTVIVDNAPIHVEPESASAVIEYLPVGMEIRVSSNPLPGGWFKVRASNGVYGWIESSYLSVQKSAEEEERKKREAEELEKDDGTPKPERDRKIFLRGLFGYNFFSAGDLNGAFNFSELNGGYGFGGELGYKFVDRVAGVLRIEMLYKNLIAKEASSNITFDLALRSYPVMAGVEFYLADLPALRLSLGLFGGLAFGTSFSVQASALDAPNSLVLQRSPFTTLARMNITRPLGRVFSIFGEAGYRYLKTEQIPTTSAQGVNGAQQIFGRTGTYVPREIDLSGFTLAVGVGVHF